MKQLLERKHGTRIIVFVLMLTMLAWLAPMNAGVAKAAEGDAKLPADGVNNMKGTKPMVPSASSTNPTVGTTAPMESTGNNPTSPIQTNPGGVADEDIQKISVTGGHLLFDKTTGTITGREGNITEAAIPEAVDGVKVTGIRYAAFFGCSSLTSVTIPGSVENIGNEAFCNCGSLEAINVDESNRYFASVEGVLFNKEKTELIDYPRMKDAVTYDIPEGVVEIATNAFKGHALTRINIPSSVSSIGSQPFTDCPALEEITVSDKNPNFSASGTVIFSRDKTTLVRYSGKCEEHSYTIPDHVTTIDREAFSGNRGLIGLTIPKGVTSMDRWMLHGAAFLEQINVDGNNPVYSSVEGALFNKDKTALIRYPRSKAGSFVVPDTVKVIEQAAFVDSFNLTEVVLPNCLERIEDQAFSGCSGLTEIEIPESVTSIGCDAFNWSVKTIKGYDGSAAYYHAQEEGISFVSLGNAVNPLTLIAVDGGNLYFYKSTGTIAKADDTITEASIPETVEGIKVTSIAARACSDCFKLTNVTIPNGVTSIGEMAFYGCGNLANVTIPDSVANIGEKAFGYYKNGESHAKFPGFKIYGYSNDSTAAKYAKDNGLKYAIVGQDDTEPGDEDSEDGDHTNDMKIPVTGGYLFFNKTKGEITGYEGEITEVVIPETFEGVKITSIRYDAFVDCSSLTSISIPNSVTSIEECAFNWCTSLTSVNIPESVTIIEWGTFSGCMGLTSVTIPESVTSIGDDAFSNCRSLANVNIPNSVTTIGRRAFQWCESLTSVSIPESVTSIGDHAFSGCGGLTSISVDVDNQNYSSQDGALFDRAKKQLIRYPVGNKSASYEIPNSVTSIGPSAFDYSGLTSISIPESVTNIGKSAFRCSELTGITIPNGVTSIGADAFSGCSRLTSITVGAGNQNYSSQDGVLFDKAKKQLIQYPIGNKRSSYEIPNSVTTIEHSAFSGCSGLSSVNIPNSVTSIEEWAFSYCSGLTSVNIPNSVTSIGEGAFNECSGLTSVNIPNSVTSIGEKAFGYYWQSGEELGDGMGGYAKVPGFKVYGYSNDSAAAKYAKENGFEYALVDKPDSGDKNDNKNDNNQNNVDQKPNGDAQNKDVEKPVVPAATKKGTTVKDKKSNGSYVVIQAKSNGGTVTYKKPVDKKKTSVTIPATVRIEGKNYKVTAIEKNAFQGNQKLKTVKIGSNVQTIGANAFNKCTKLKTVKLPSKVKTIQKGAFANCKNLKTITIQTKKLTKKTVGAGAFKGVSSKATVKVPKGKAKAYQKLLRSKGLSKKAKVK